LISTLTGWDLPVLRTGRTGAWAALRRDDIELMVARPLEGDLFEQPAFTGSFYILVEDGIDRLWAELKDQAVICYPVEDFVYGMREFALYDNNGYLLQFGQDTEKA
jgi:uncharacterized glyoxalase superfamily protein PhnB